jgi:uncharacterized coiled-coil DUF342 family protein
MRGSLLERFLARVYVPSDSPTACWTWTGNRATKGGYGRERDEKDAACDRLRDKCNELTIALGKSDQEVRRIKTERGFKEAWNEVLDQMGAYKDRAEKAERELAEARKAADWLWDHRDRVEIALDGVAEVVVAYRRREEANDGK